MTFDYVNVDPEIDTNADIYPRRIGRRDERVLYGIDPAFIAEAYNERLKYWYKVPSRTAYEYDLERSISRRLKRSDGSRSSLPFLECVEDLRDCPLWGVWLKDGYVFGSRNDVSSDEAYDMLKAYPGCAVTDWAEPVSHVGGSIRLDELKACYHDIGRMSRVFTGLAVESSAGTRTTVHKSGYGEPETKIEDITSGSGFNGGYSEEYYHTDYSELEEYTYVSHEYSVKAKPEIDIVEVPFRSAIALIAVDTYEENMPTNSKSTYDILALPIGSDGSIGISGGTFRSIALSHKSMSPIDGHKYKLDCSAINSFFAVVDIDAKTILSKSDVEAVG